MSREHEINFALRNLRHLYEQMLVPGRVFDTASAAKGLLGPAIEKLERTVAELERMEKVVEASLELRRVESTDVPGESIAELTANIPAAQRRSMVALTKWRGIVGEYALAVAEREQS